MSQDELPNSFIVHFRNISWMAFITLSSSKEMTKETFVEVASTIRRDETVTDRTHPIRE
jgi:hypothetical protein